MAAFTAPFGAGISYAGPVPSAGLNAINTDLPKAPNFVDGDAEYTPSAAVTVGGAGIYIKSTGWRLLSGAQVNNYGGSFVGASGIVGLTITGGAGANGLTVTAGSGGAAGVASTGTGSGPGVQGTGGSGGGAGGAFTGAAGGNGLTGTGQGAGIGVVGTGGSSGIGGYFSGNGGSVALQIAGGNAKITGTQPAATADPGENNYLCATNLCKAWAMVSLSGGTATLLDGYNIASVLRVSTTHILVTFARAFASTNYCPVATGANNPGKVAVTDFGTRTTTTLEVAFQDHAGGAVDVSTATLHFALQVMGRQ